MCYDKIKLGELMNCRPDFKDIKTYEDFEKYYWYREELQAICKSLGLEYNANKTELNKIIKAWFNGEKIVHLPKTKIKASSEELTLSTSLIKCGFTFGNKFREFFIKVTNDKNFKFTADMVATAKLVKQCNDVNFTLGDLLDIKTGKKEYVKFDNSACQWNKFLKDFCADENNNCYSNKLKTASKFWVILRESNLPKKYTREFIEENIGNIK